NPTSGSTPSFAGRGPSATGGSPRQTPCLRWNVAGNRWQPVATDLACFSVVWVLSICDQLPLVAPAGLHKGSIRGSAGQEARAASLSPQIGEYGEHAAIVLRRFFDPELCEGTSDVRLDRLGAEP